MTGCLAKLFPNWFSREKHRYEARVKYRFAFSVTVTARSEEGAVAQAIEMAKECAEFKIRRAHELEQMTEDIDYEIEYLRRRENGEAIEIDHEAIFAELYPPWED